MLTAGEIKVQELLLNGLSNKEIAQNLNISEKTVKFHLTKIYKKHSVSGDRQLIARLLKKGVFFEQ